MKLVIFICFFVLTISCSKTKKEIFKEQLQMVDTKIDFEKYDYIVIIPNEGCTDCITKASDYFIKDIENLKRTIVIYTSISDNKIFKLKLPKSYLNHRNVFLDKSGFLENFEISSVYPQILKMEHGKIVFIKNFDNQMF